MRSILSRLRNRLWPEVATKPRSVHAKLPTVGPPEGKINVNSDTWLFIKQWAEHELQTVREQNDKLTLGETDTAALRGDIKRLKALITLPEPAKERKLVKDDYEPTRLSGYSIR